MKTDEPQAVLPPEHLAIADASEFYSPRLASEWPHDPEMARALLAEAGYPDGFDGAMLSTAQYGMLPSRAEVCQAYLSMIGVSVTLNLPEWTTRTLEVTIAASLIATGVPLGPMGRSGRMAGRMRWFR
ncbi:hypothetical protein AL035_17725 [Salipiger aestuarii]|uniref:Extracellular solute-binding protein (Family 5) n=1 Tax=Salipiger aestuarii TaxID=568098 RepID=A0A327XSG7_9RHOB|nr:ABC transporter substrate-binding protein [Salipiger aestuarii]KAB2539823.1 hypothetical protein AL035_17725 [Salipiger aestuarii]RAK11988.1 extracellular solute-binding protein (family 5) [Salipiger aestuarii]